MSSKVWFITGANSGFGRAITEAALNKGDVVVAAARKPSSLDDLLASHPDQLDPVALDVTDQSQIATVVADAVKRHGRIDVLVNNAGRGLVGAVEETTDAELRDLMDLHFFGPAALTRAVLAHMRDRKSGAIVQLTSMGGRVSFPGVGGYSATKFALEGLTEALAGEVAPFGIKVLIVEPGAFRTGFNKPGALLSSTPIDAYQETVGQVRENLANDDGSQPGDPAKAASAVITALEAEQTPLRLALGGDAYELIADRVQAEQTELTTWESTSRGTAFS